LLCFLSSSLLPSCTRMHFVCMQLAQLRLCVYYIIACTCTCTTLILCSINYPLTNEIMLPLLSCY
jgi:hypothetical protein